MIEIIIQFFTLLLLGGIVYVIGTAIVAMARNQALHWETLLGILLVLMIGLGLLQWYIPQTFKSLRIGMEAAAPERDALQAELNRWVPRIIDNTQPTVVPVVEPVVITATPELVIVVATPFKMDSPPTYQPPTPLPTNTPQPTPCIIHLDNGTAINCPPTPRVYQP